MTVANLESASPIVRAGRLIAVVGWVFLGFVGVVVPVASAALHGID